MGTSDPLPGSLCIHISPPGVPENSGLSTKKEKRCGRGGGYLAVLSFKYYIRNTRTTYMMLSLLALNKSKCFKLLSSRVTLFTQNIFFCCHLLLQKTGHTWLVASHPQLHH